MNFQKGNNDENECVTNMNLPCTTYSTFEVLNYWRQNHFVNLNSFSFTFAGFNLDQHLNSLRLSRVVFIPVTASFAMLRMEGLS